ncbi:MAG: hypothetical protein V3S04_05110 [Candidatus Omnitrophota bacterium]
MNIQRRSIYRSAGRKRGGLLILAIWTICLLTTFAVILSYGVRQKVTLIKRLDDRDRLRYIVDACVKRAIIDLKRSVVSDEDKTKDNWNAIMSAEKEILLGEHLVKYEIIDEERKINLNTADRHTIKRLFQLVVGLGEMDAQEIAASIVDWRDEDSMLSIAMGSAEDRYYEGRSYPYGAMDRDLEIPDEVLLIKGFTPEILEKSKDYMTIYGDGKININTAPKEVFLVLGLSEYLSDLICLYRYGEDGIMGTGDDNYFDSREKIMPDLSSFYHLSDSQVAELSRIVNKHLTVDSHYFTVKGEVVLIKGKGSSSIACIIDHTGDVIYWHES